MSHSVIARIGTFGTVFNSGTIAAKQNKQVLLLIVTNSNNNVQGNIIVLSTLARSVDKNT